MKTITQIDSEIQESAKELGNELSTSCRTNRRATAIKKNIAKLRQYKLYLQTNVREEYLKSSKDVLEKRIESISEKYYLWVGENATKYKDPYSRYNEETGINIMREQLKTVEYLLS
jgi:hypothetical protein